ncbi:hypothetical protein N7481_002555 [Penicillium waksmanii]|uniref:uncharacterized protein n=1 Tax=Penicillium waksmanii TaxID=69791 RepID=UPI002549A286|nr:uncharacterized protein N7481_002555 [Penicillium waksmanii]KAJ5995578.1 hypothetical protein N7481_002555 [Penicillium waksmanii]
MPSLALTDPDMILPYDGSERQSQTPSPPSQLVYLSNLNARYNSNSASDPHAVSSGSGSSSGGRPKKNFSRSAWTHEDLSTSASRRLSDIGEELSPARSVGFDEQEEEAQGQYQGQYAGAPQHGLTSWPGLPDSDSNDTNDNASSSSSTVSAGSTRAREESKSHESVSSQGQGQGQNQDQARDQTQVPAQEQEQEPDLVQGASNELKGLPDKNTIASAVKGKGPGDEFSSAILSSEAERILDNAKKRLTLMEGNLNRARSTVRATPSPSPSAPGNTSPMGMPAGGLYRSISKTDRRSSTLRRQSYVPPQDGSTNRHSRVHSETNFPPESSLSTDTKKVSRSVSAMGSSSSSLHNDDRSFQYAPTRAYLTHRASISSIRPPHLEALSQSQSNSYENSPQSPQSARSRQSGYSPVASHSPVSISHEGSSQDSPQGLGISAEDESRSTNGGDFSPVYSSYGPPSRAQSQLQVRDLQYQMKGLHIKISSLKVRTQEDNLRRRSLQSLRTPSPLTAADPWYQNGLEIRDGTSSRGSNARESRPHSQNLTKENNSPRETDESHTHRSQSQAQAQSQSQSQSKRASSTWQDQPSYHDSRNQSTAQSMYEDAEEGYYDGEIDREALDEILREPLDEDLESQLDYPQNGEGVPHEEREDAFDYEHFILHSALGNYSRQLRRASSASRESAETTRPTHRPVQHSRTNSNMSDSTVATFATATEGDIPEEEDEINSVMYWDRRFNHELRHRHVDEPVPETDRSETPRGPRGGEGDGDTTPVEGQFFDANGRSSSATTGSATPTSLVSSLVSTVRAASASSPHPGSATPTQSGGGINDDDTQMLEQLFSSLGNVCMDLQAITTSPEPDLKSAKILRRRLDAARRVLDGELDT